MWDESWHDLPTRPRPSTWNLPRAAERASAPSAVQAGGIACGGWVRTRTVSRHLATSATGRRAFGPHLDEDWAHPWKQGRSALCQPRLAAAASRAARRRRARRCARSRSTHGGSQRQCFGRSSMQHTSCTLPRNAAQRACGSAAASARQRLRRALGVGERRDGLCDGGGDVRRHACATARSEQPITLALSGISRLSARGGGAAASSFFKSQRRQDSASAAPLGDDRADGVARWAPAPPRTQLLRNRRALAAQSLRNRCAIAAQSLRICCASVSLSRPGAGAPSRAATVATDRVRSARSTSASAATLPHAHTRRPRTHAATARVSEADGPRRRCAGGVAAGVGRSR